jgi:hypothetical protein
MGSADAVDRGKCQTVLPRAAGGAFGSFMTVWRVESASGVISRAVPAMVPGAGVQRLPRARPPACIEAAQRIPTALQGSPPCLRAARRGPRSRRQPDAAERPSRRCRNALRRQARGRRLDPPGFAKQISPRFRGSNMASVRSSLRRSCGCIWRDKRAARAATVVPRHLPSRDRPRRFAFDYGGLTSPMALPLGLVS